ncbi:MAG TPA: hypothetical protein VNZ86_17620 [Bacteroidia bacterium]|jgi:hypothetical protein|nr:hypothetical protein [Bacteroidia bacterium]
MENKQDIRDYRVLGNDKQVHNQAFDLTPSDSPEQKTNVLSILLARANEAGIAISFSTSMCGYHDICVTDALGGEVFHLQQYFPTGKNEEVVLNIPLSTGIYMIRICNELHVATGKLLFTNP